MISLLPNQAYSETCPSSLVIGNCLQQYIMKPLIHKPQHFLNCCHPECANRLVPTTSPPDHRYQTHKEYIQFHSSHFDVAPQDGAGDRRHHKGLVLLRLQSCHPHQNQWCCQGFFNMPQQKPFWRPENTKADILYDPALEKKESNLTTASSSEVIALL